MARKPTKKGYEQAYADHKYLWDIGPANDMTGAYVDQEDLAELLASPTRATARKCLQNQIVYWFQAGPDIDGAANSIGIMTENVAQDLIESDPRVKEIYERYV